jgi:hypothetical protein
MVVVYLNSFWVHSFPYDFRACCSRQLKSRCVKILNNHYTKAATIAKNENHRSKRSKVRFATSPTKTNSDRIPEDPPRRQLHTSSADARRSVGMGVGQGGRYFDFGM